MSERAFDDEHVDVLVELRWDDYNTGLLVEKLFRHVRRDELRFDLRARRGSVETTFALAIEQGQTADVVDDVVRYLLGRTRRAQRSLSEPAVVLLDGGDRRRFTVGDDDDVRRIVERVHRIVRDERQRDLEDFSR